MTTIVLERRFWPNFAFVFLGLIICLSIWQMGMLTNEPPKHIALQFSNIQAYTLNTNHTPLYIYPIETLPSSDYTTLMNFSNFHFTLVNECASPVILLVLVHSAPDNFQRRKSIRETWGEKRSGLKLVFVLGKIEDSLLQKQLEKEINEHRDFVQGNFLDAYRNMTYKHVAALKYAIYHCFQAKYILKTDDDVFVNMPTMFKFLSSVLSLDGARNLLLCTPHRYLQVIRSYRSKWRVSFGEYKYRYYPPYCTGWALLYSPDVLFTLYRSAQNSEYFWIDDALITGILARKENIQHTSMNNWILSREYIEQIVTPSSAKYNNSKIFLFGPPNISIQSIYSLWNFIRYDTDFKTPLGSYS